MAKISESEAPPRLKANFKQLDKDGDGELDRREMGAAMMQMRPGAEKPAQGNRTRVNLNLTNLARAMGNSRVSLRSRIGPLRVRGRAVFRKQNGPAFVEDEAFRAVLFSKHSHTTS